MATNSLSFSRGVRFIGSKVSSSAAGRFRSAGQEWEQGFGAGYAYDHDAEDGFSGQNYFPEGMKRGVYYTPVDRGFERELKKRVDYFAGLRAKRGKN